MKLSDENSLNDEKRWGEYERDYRGAAKFEETGGVLHQAGGTNILVPDALPSEGSAPAGTGRKPVSGYKSPIHHHEVGMMDTTPTAFSHKQEDERLTFVPDAIGADRGDIKDKAIGSTQPDARSTAGSVADRSVGEAADVARSTRARDIVNREDDRMHHTDRGSKLSPVEQTLEGDAIFNSEDIRGRMHERGNVTVYSLSWSPDGRTLASASNDRTVRLWEASSDRELETLTGHTGAVYGVSWSPSGRMLASASQDRRPVQRVRGVPKQAQRRRRLSVGS